VGHAIDDGNRVSLVPGEMEDRDAYRLLLSAIVPRPIAWVSTLAEDGTRNLAPFSFFNAVSGRPPVVMFSVSPRSARLGGGEKDTLRNVRATREAVIHLVPQSLTEAMNRTSGEWPPDVDEFVEAGLTPLPSIDVRPPRIAAAPIALETKLHQLVPVEDSGNVMVLCRVVRYHVRADLLRASGLVDASLLAPITRLGGREYAHLGEVFSLERPRT
jgi:flavin reductase (DIM6/NTAB) family NADH-FMN oxidoreductase RutF